MGRPSTFKVSTDYIAGEQIWRCYRLRDVDKIDHSGNREYREGLFHSREEAQEAVDYWNEKEYGIGTE